MTDIEINGIVTWLKNWFNDKTEITSLLNGKVNVAQGNGNADKVLITDSGGAVTTGAKNGHSHGSITSDGKIGSTSGLPVKTGTGGALTTGSFGTTSGTFAEGNHTHNTTNISNTYAYDNIKSGESTTVTLTNQKLINDAINTKLGNLLDADIIKVVDSLGTASASTMNALYLVAKSGGATGDGYDIWITVRTGSSGSYSYAWEKVDDFTLQQNIETTTNKVSSWSSTTNNTHYPSEKLVKDSLDTKITKSSSATGLLKDNGDVMTSGTGASNWAVGNHTHGNIYNDGTINSTEASFSRDNCPIIANSSNEIVKGIYLDAYHILDTTAYTNIGLSEGGKQTQINSAINTALGGKASVTDIVDFSYTDATTGFTNGVCLVPKTDDATGTIKLHLKSS